MLTIGSNTDSAEATRITANLDALRSAVLTYSNEVGSWNRNAFRTTEVPSDGGLVSIASISPYLDRSVDRFEVLRSNDRLLAGFPDASKLTAAVADKLAKTAQQDGLMNRSGTTYSSGTAIYIYVR